MCAYGMSLQEAITYLGKQYANLMRLYMDTKARLRKRSLGNEGLEEHVMRFIEAMEFWPIGNLVRTLATLTFF